MGEGERGEQPALEWMQWKPREMAKALLVFRRGYFFIFCLGRKMKNAKEGCPLPEALRTFSLRPPHDCVVDLGVFSTSPRTGPSSYLAPQTHEACAGEVL